VEEVLGRKLVALLEFRNERRHLPDWLRSVAPEVDAIVALDDGSSDGSAAIVEEQPALLDLIRLPPRADDRRDGAANRRALHEAVGR